MAQLRIDAKPVTYRGVAMRSQLEGDWAATLDHLGITWEYEPQKLTLGSGTRYVPDFLLPDLRTLIEVKGAGVPGLRKPAELAAQFPGVIVIIGVAPGRRMVAESLWESFAQWRDAAGYDTRLTQCPGCSQWQWLRPQISRRCRLCSDLHQGFLATSGEIPFHAIPREFHQPFPAA